MNLSISCAQMIQNAIDKKYLLSSNNHRFANFAVLRTPDIPAVLVELGFLSNPEDEKKLNSDFYLRIIASKLVSAIDLFFMDKKAL
jgi:N-acetylmuramoyl-L-alanine amidase